MVGTETEVVRYGIMQRSLGVISLIFVALGSVYSPEFSRAWRVRQVDAVRRAFVQSRALGRLLFAPVALVVAVWPSQVMRILGGDQASGIPRAIVFVMAIAQLTNSLVGLTSELLQMSGRVRADLLATLAGLAAIVAALLWPGELSALTRSSVAFAAGVSLKNIITGTLVRRTLLGAYSGPTLSEAGPRTTRS